MNVASLPSRGARGDINVSFEFFPPKTDEMEANLWEAIARLAPLRPRFVSVTYGAGGSTRERTHATVERLVRETDIAPAAHLTCVAASRDEIDTVVREYHAAGVRHIVALRGDPQGGIGSAFTPHPQGYANSTELVAGIGASAISKCRSRPIRKSIRNRRRSTTTSTCLKAKVDAGATRAITQFFFENECYLRFLDRARYRGVTIPIVPGIVPVQNFKQTASFAKRAGASIPQWLADRFEGLDDDLATRRLIAAAVAAEQVLGLVDRGVTDFHFYTMNRADLVYAICHLLGLRPNTDARATAEAA